MMCPGSGDDCFTIFAYRERRTESINGAGMAPENVLRRCCV
jgi:hypothetical protein